ncbi:MAG: recombinase zinc beta ribbon domain-containing protein, partial [Terracidiphilus sp.]
CDVAGAGNGFTVWLLRHSQRKRGATARLDLRNTAPVLDPTNVWNRTRVVRNPTSRRKEQRRRPESEWVRVEVPEWRIVSEELWNAAVEANKSRRGPSWWKEGGLNRSAASRRYLFSGLLNCPECGGNFNVIGGQGQSARYGCIGHRYRGTCRNKLTILRRLLEPQLLKAISGSLLDPAVRERLSRDYHHQVLAACEERTLTAQRVASTAEELQERKIELRRKAENLMDSIQDLGRSSLLSERMKSVDAEMHSIDLLLATQTEVAIEPLTAEAIRELLDRKLTDLEAVLMGDPEVAKQRIRKHIAKLVLTPVNTDGGPRYEVSGDVSVFARGDADDVLHRASFQRSRKQYTSLSFPFKATLNPRAELRRKRSGVDGRYMTLD